MPLLFTDDRFLRHETGKHPECPARIAAIYARLDAAGLRDRFAAGVSRPATDAELLRVHSPGYLRDLAAYATSGGGRIEVDTVVCPESESVARLAAGSACAAVDAVLNGDHFRAAVLARPPGHHALADGAMGFCLFNNVAVAAAHARAAHGVNRVLIVDWDVHHGNGTQDIFYGDETVTFLSVHRWPFYPGTGAADETGTGPGLGRTINLPLPYGVRRSSYLAAFGNALSDALAASRPELILLSAGFDAHRADPVGDLGLETEDFAALTRLLRDAADSHTGGRLVSLLEGGYNTAVLADCVAVHLEGLL